jgi:hypothetical protein
MAGESLAKARAELNAAGRALERMKKASSFQDFEDAWKELLSGIEKVWTKTEHECATRSSKFKPWQGKYTSARRNDPLLRYLHHARNADQHTIQQIVDHRPGHMTLNALGGGSWYIKHMEIRGGQVVSYRGDKPLVQTVHPPRIELLKVLDRGVSYAPPTEHAGRPLERRDPITIAELALAYYTEFVNEAAAKFC